MESGISADHETGLTRGGRNLEEKRPGALELVTSGPINHYRTLLPGDPLYADFAQAWRQQDEWDRAIHFVYWRIALRVWPSKDGPVSKYEALSWWVWSWRRFGLTDAEIARRLGHKYDTLRSKGAFARADEHAKQLEAEAQNRVWVRVPRIVAIEIENRPGVLQRWSDPRLSEVESEPTRRLHEKLAALTFNGPRGEPLTVAGLEHQTRKRDRIEVPPANRLVTNDPQKIAAWFKEHIG
jgi:hypothetical protein